MGMGLDCHRTWEALALGCIVLLQDQPPVRLYVECKARRLRQGGSGLAPAGSPQRQVVPQAAPGSGQPRPICRSSRACFRRRGCCSAWVCPWSPWRTMHGSASRARSCSGGWMNITPRRAELCTPRGSAGGGGCEIYAWLMRVNQAGGTARLTVRRYRLEPVAMTAPPPLRRSPALGPAGREALRCPLAGRGPAGAHTAAKECPFVSIIPRVCIIQRVSIVGRRTAWVAHWQPRPRLRAACHLPFLPP
jgi:hypothetical protein